MSLLKNVWGKLFRKKAPTTCDLQHQWRPDPYRLIQAAMDGDLRGIKALIAAGADVNAKGGAGGTTALMYAVTRGRVDCVKALIAAGADVNAKSNRGQTAFMVASANPFRNDRNNAEFENIIEALKAAGAEE